MDVTIRPERENEYRIVEELTREAFWNLYAPGASEHFLLHCLRKSPSFIKELDLVALHDAQIVGNIVYSLSMVREESGKEHEVITFGPVSVHPALQGKGIGSALIRHSQKVAADLGYKAVLICGHPDYYCRFGFECGKKYGIATSDGSYLKALMAMELYDGALRGINGRFFEDPAFACNEAEVAAFDALFPKKEKAVTESQKQFAVLSNALA